nr:MAG TPA: hypothetical protein [Caudoviricetes sp.]
MGTFGRYLYMAFIVGLTCHLIINHSIWWIFLFLLAIAEFKK